MSVLEGIRILELGNFIAAPTATRLLADFGAEVIKIEQPGVGDPTRQWRLERGETSMLWRTLGRNKKSLTLDLSKSAGIELFKRLASKSDAVLENFRPGKLESWGVAPKRLRELNPDLILVRISGYGQTGPYRARPGFGAVAESLGGLRYLTGYPDRPPTRVGVSIGDSIAGLYAVIGLLLGLTARARGRQDSPETVDVALTESVLSMMESLLPDRSAYGITRTRQGNATHGVAPTGTYPCVDDQWVVIAGNSDRIFPRVMHAIGRDDLAHDPGLRTNPQRWERQEMLNGVIAGWTAQRSVAEVVTRMVEADVPVGPIYSADDILADPQYRERGMLIEREVQVESHPETVVFPGIVPKLERSPGELRWLGPELGQHTESVLTQILELSQAEIAQLREEEVI